MDADEDRSLSNELRRLFDQAPLNDYVLRTKAPRLSAVIADRNRTVIEPLIELVDLLIEAHAGPRKNHALALAAALGLSDSNEQVSFRLSSVYARFSPDNKTSTQESLARGGRRWAYEGVDLLVAYLDANYETREAVATILVGVQTPTHHQLLVMCDSKPFMQEPSIELRLSSGNDKKLSHIKSFQIVDIDMSVYDEYGVWVVWPGEVIPSYFIDADVPTFNLVNESSARVNFSSLWRIPRG